MVSKKTTIEISSEARDTLKELGKVQGTTYSETIAQFAGEKPIGPLARNSGKEQGTIFLSSTGTVYKAPPVTPEKIRKMLKNAYIVSQLTKRALVMFPEKLKIEAYNPRQKIDPVVTQRIQNMIETADVRMNEKVRAADGDALAWGMGFFNPVWERSKKNNEIVLSKLRYLSAEGFDTPPTLTKTTLKNWSPLLQGVILNEETGQPEYYRRTDSLAGTPEQITNIMTVSDPQDAGLAGDSKLIPLIQFCEMLEYLWNTEMQAKHRAGSPIFFLKITNPQEASTDNGGLGDVAYGNIIIKKWSKNKQFILRANMEIIPLPLEKTQSALTTIDVIEKVIENYFSVTKLLSGGDGNSLNDSSVSKFKLINQSAKGLHNWLLSPFENLLNQYFVLNHFPDGWFIRLKIQLIEEDQTQQKQKAAEIGISGQCVDLDDLRALLNLDPADDEKKKSIAAFWASKAQAATPAQFTQHSHAQFTEEGDEPDPLADDMADDLDKEIDALSSKVLKALGVAA